MTPSQDFRPLVLIPTYNTGPKLPGTVESVISQKIPVWVIVDGSNDGSDELLPALEEKYKREELRVTRLDRNEGKGCAVLAGAILALREGFTHMLTVDSDGQHPSETISEYVARSRENPGAMILGQPIFDDSAPRIRVNGRKYANVLAAIEVLGFSIGDALFGMRLYPLQEFVQRMECSIRRGAQRYDFEPEIAVRLVWDGVRVIKLPTPVKYFNESEGGISHYHYWRDNFKMAEMHGLRLLPGMAIRLPLILWRKFFKPGPSKEARLFPKRIASKFCGHYHYYYSLAKLRSDPLYESVSQILQSAKGGILDVGCGLGLLGHYLRMKGVLNPYFGFDYDEEKISAAIEAARNEPDMHFQIGDAREQAPRDFQGNVTLLDMLQFMSDEGRAMFLTQVAQWIAPGGVLIIRNCIDDGSWRFGVTELCDRFSSLAEWMKDEPQSYPTFSGLNEILEPLGLECEVQSLWGKTPFSNYLITYRRT